MAEMLTMQIVNEYIGRARNFSDKSRQDVGERRKLRIELQNRCRLTELQAVNIINGFHVRDYVTIEKRKAKEQEQEKEA